MRFFALVAAASIATAPFQCASKVDPNRRTEEDAGEALYALAEKFKAEGNAQARGETLKYIVEKYPASRFATSAKVDLEDMAKGK